MKTERDRLIYSRYQKGESLMDIAIAYVMSVHRVIEIVRLARKREQLIYYKELSINDRA